MPFEFIQIPANGQGNAREALNQLLRRCRIASLRKEFVSHGEDSFWAFCVEHIDAVLQTQDRARASSSHKIDYKELLSEVDFAAFVRLRELRKVIAEKEAIPAYAIFTNEQLAAMVTGKCDSLSALGAIPGVGAARIEKYGLAFLNTVHAKEVGG